MHYEKLITPRALRPRTNCFKFTDERFQTGLFVIFECAQARGFEENLQKKLRPFLLKMFNLNFNE